MTMLMQTHGPLERASCSSETPDAVVAGPAKAHLAAIKRFCLCALAALLVGGGLVAIMAIKVAAVFWRLRYS